MSERKRTKFAGVYSRESSTRRHGGKPDVCFDITFKSGTRKVWEKVGWKSEGISAAYASQVRAERVRDIRLGASPVAKVVPMTFAEAFERYRVEHLSQIKGERILGLYNARIKEAFGDRKLNAITTMELEQFKRELLEDGLTPATVRHYLGTIRQVYLKLIDWGLYFGKVPTAKVQMPKKDNKRQRFLSKAEADILLAALWERSRTTHIIAKISLHTGMRFGEIAALRGEHVHMKSGTIRIVESKNGKSRTTFMTQDVHEIFMDKLLAPGQLLFPDRKGNKMVTVSRSFQRTVDELGYNARIIDTRDKVVFHTLRHTYASWLVQRGIPLYTVGELLGHSSTEMTQRYSHLAPDNLRAAVEVFEQILREG